MKKRKWYTLYGQIVGQENLRLAFRKVKANGGAPGIDGQTIERFEARLGQNLAELERQLRQKRYRPSPVRRHYTEKPDGSLRPLGIPTVRDRVVQQAVLNVLDKHAVFESKFMDTSYGFRPGRSTRMAMRRIQKHLKEGRDWVVDADLKSYFDTIPHERLMAFVAEEIADGSVLRLIRAWLRAGVMDGGEVTYPKAGTPQGGVISPLLANIYLHYFDVKMADLGYEVIRYADVYAESRKYGGRKLVPLLRKSLAVAGGQCAMPSWGRTSLLSLPSRIDCAPGSVGRPLLRESVSRRLPGR